MKKIILLVASLILVASAAVFAADPPPPPPLGITVGIEAGLASLGTTTGTDKPAFALGYTFDFFHSIDNFDFEFFLQRSPFLSPAGGPTQVSGATAQGVTPWFGAMLYWEVDGYYNFKITKDFTLTPGLSFQDSQYFGTVTNTSGVFAQNAAYDAFAFEPSLKATIGPVAVKLADNIIPALDATALTADKAIHELWAQVGVTISDFNVYARVNFQPTISKLTWFKWGVSKGLISGVSIYTYGSVNFFETTGAYKAGAYYNQALGFSLAF